MHKIEQQTQPADADQEPVQIPPEAPVSTEKVTSLPAADASVSTPSSTEIAPMPQEVHHTPNSVLSIYFILFDMCLA